MARRVKVCSLFSSLASRMPVPKNAGVPTLGLNHPWALNAHSVLCSQGQQVSTMHRTLFYAPKGNSPEEISVHFVNQNGDKTTTSVTDGVSLLDVVINKNIDISGFGACEGVLSCSTCHLIFEQNIYDKLGPMEAEEMDMLDLAYGVTKTSRLGCQVRVQKWMDGMTVFAPKDQNELRDSGSAGKQ
ncbi:hypothetical protein JZ751_029864 [Albula glossodonta]|uniref:2Fe-2S ferredoxin-type domain-containing protein n=1 Tax=Albula glossodonta TaxID=121402 RepID=A0A8T2MUS1_9TELE|nr:hypothetical protein JZ751_029864 [Albula glossodonta]